MSAATASCHTRVLPEVVQRARETYMKRICEASGAAPWWTAVAVTASSARQAGRYEQEIERRKAQGKLPSGVKYVIVPDISDRRLGSGGATLNVLRILAERAPADFAGLERWWLQQRVLVIHSGGDSRRLPEYSLAGKLFSAVPVKMPWGEVSTVFDEMLSLSTLWVTKAAPGLAVASGDVVLMFDEAGLEWSRPGVCGVAIRQPVDVGAHHGVYVVGDQSRVYSFLQKPSAAEVQAAGGLLENGEVALDSGLLHCDAATSCRLTMTARELFDGAEPVPAIDLYQHITLGLTGQWSPEPSDLPAFHALATAMRGTPFACCLVDGHFTHVGTTSHFRKLITEEDRFTDIYGVQQRLGKISPPGMSTAGSVIDSVFRAGGELGPESISIECDLGYPVRAGRGAIIHGLTGIAEPIEVPDDTVVHQLAVALPDGRRGVSIRVYGVFDDPKIPLPDALWFGRPLLHVLAELGVDSEEVWPGVAGTDRSLWNAQLFVVGDVAEAWKCARWMMSFGGDYSAERWRTTCRVSLASSALWADMQVFEHARNQRMHSRWQLTALALARSGSDIRPLLAQAPAIGTLADTARALAADAQLLLESAPTEAASRQFQAGLFFGQSGLECESEGARGSAFNYVRQAVERGAPQNAFDVRDLHWQYDRVVTSSPARIDLGGGWSDTPPFCLDWGGTVLNTAITVRGRNPIGAAVRRIPDMLVRCTSAESGEVAEYREAEDLTGSLSPGNAFAIQRAALQLAGIVRPGESLARSLMRYGGGLEISTWANLPMGSGLGTSSILAAAVVQALAVMMGIRVGPYEIVDNVLLLEQKMTTGGGWQDQVGGIFPGAKITTSGPGLRQRLRVQPLAWSAARQADFAERFVFYYTGIRRVAKDLLAQVVGSYLAREAATVQVLHNIKTLAVEMGFALQEGDWEYLGELLDRHWKLNQILDPHTTNAPINRILEELRPLLAGAKLAGAGGGGFLLLLAKSPDSAKELRRRLSSSDFPGALYEASVANTGLAVVDAE